MSAIAEKAAQAACRRLGIQRGHHSEKWLDVLRWSMGATVTEEQAFSMLAEEAYKLGESSH